VMVRRCFRWQASSLSRAVSGASQPLQLYNIKDTQVALYKRRHLTKGIFDLRIHSFQKNWKAMFPYNLCD
jgi:hypothetical protein